MEAGSISRLGQEQSAGLPFPFQDRTFAANGDYSGFIDLVSHVKQFGIDENRGIPFAIEDTLEFE